MIVAGLQLDIAWEAPEENYRRAAALARQAVTSGAGLLVLPEMFATGFSMRSEMVAGFAGATRSFLSDLARELEVWVIGGYAEAGRLRPRNACSVIDPGGEERGRYHKVHPFSLAGEERHYEGGEEMATVAVEGLRVTPLICYDLRFPELFRHAAEATDLFAVIANWPERRGHAWRTLLRARAIDAQAFILGVNRVGEAQGHPHRGDSALVDPMGEVVSTSAFQPAAVVGEVDPQRVVEVRRRFGFLADRRPEVYGRLE
jgi:predicted amidohydrolase